MRGHEAIIRMRSELGVKPVFVFINDFPCETDWFEDGGKHARVCVHGDDLNNIDMRFLVGLGVCAASHSEDRAKALFDRCKEAGAVTVASIHLQYGVHEFKQSGWAKAWRKEVAHG
jgi:hypothetical protein